MAGCGGEDEDLPAQLTATWDVQAGDLHCYPEPPAADGPTYSVLPVDPYAARPGIEGRRCEWRCATYLGVRDRHVVLDFAWVEQTWGCDASGLNCGPRGPSWTLWTSHADGC